MTVCPLMGRAACTFLCDYEDGVLITIHTALEKGALFSRSPKPAMINLAAWCFIMLEMLF